MTLFSLGVRRASMLLLGVAGAATIVGGMMGACALPGYSIGDVGAGGSGGRPMTTGTGGSTSVSSSSSSSSGGDGGAGGDATGGGGTAGAGGAGGSPPMDCTTNADCKEQPPICNSYKCKASVCTLVPVADIIFASGMGPNVKGDCNKAMCAQGHLKFEADPSDVPSDDNPCTTDVCNGGAIDHSQGAGDTCVSEPNNPGMVGFCSTDLKCVECLPVSQTCANGCFEGQCIGATCKNSMQDPEETYKDCGGPCPGCPDNKPCVVAKDCLSGVCKSGFCAQVSCQDGVRNGDEAGTDCGASCGKGCAVGSYCKTDTDCLSGLCLLGACQFTCGTGQKDGAETGPDCGGPICPACPAP